MTEAIYIERHGTVASIILNRPEKLNALDLPEWRRIGELMHELDGDDPLRCVVIRRVDSRASSAGADIAGFEANRNKPDQVREYGGALASSLAERAPLVNRWHKKFVRRPLKPEPPTAEELDAGYAAYDTEDYHIGYEAFLAKRKPEFKEK